MTDEEELVKLTEDGDDGQRPWTTYRAPGHGTFNVWDVELDNHDIPALWHEFRGQVPAGVTARKLVKLFAAYLTLRGIDLDRDEIDYCASCGIPDWNESIYHDTADGYVCDSCANDYQQCAECETAYRDLEQRGTTVSTGDIVCASCIRDYYGYCGECEEYYRYDFEHAHEDNRSDCCDSPQVEFSVRNGDGALDNDTRVTVNLPAQVTDSGLTMIYNLLGNLPSASGDGMTFDEKTVLWEIVHERVQPCWQTSRGNYPKRLARAIAQTLKVKLPPEIIAQVGNIARANGAADADEVMKVEVTRELNMSAAEFYNDDSCWWGSYSESRCALKSNGGFGIRSFGSYGSVEGRAWVIPLRQVSPETPDGLRPTFDATHPDALIVFNGYGNLFNGTAARILSGMYGWDYKHVGLDDATMYINGNRGYLVAPDVILKANDNVRLHCDEHSTLYYVERLYAERQAVAPDVILKANDNVRLHCDEHSTLYYGEQNEGSTANVA